MVHFVWKTLGLPSIIIHRWFNNSEPVSFLFRQLTINWEDINLRYFHLSPVCRLWDHDISNCICTTMPVLPDEWHATRSFRWCNASAGDIPWVACCILSPISFPFEPGDGQGCARNPKRRSWSRNQMEQQKLNYKALTIFFSLFWFPMYLFPFLSSHIVACSFRADMPRTLQLSSVAV